jgi:hypothetical protein
MNHSPSPRKRSAWDLVERQKPKKSKPRLIVTFSQDDNVGGATPRIFFFYYHLVRYEASQKFSDAWLATAAICRDDFCLPYTKEGPCGVANVGIFSFMDDDAKDRKVEEKKETE